MAKYSEEGNSQGLGWIDAEVQRFKISETIKYKIPNTGWNQICNQKKSKLTHQIPDKSEFYFVHSYHMKCNDHSDILHTTTYEYDFVSAIEKNNIFGVQYHPEKSHALGNQLIQNFIDL